MIFSRSPILRLPLLFALVGPLLLTACWLPPKEVIQEKAAARKAWRAQEKQRKEMREAYPKQVARVTQELAIPRDGALTISVNLPDDDVGVTLATTPSAPAPSEENGSKYAKAVEPTLPDGAMREPIVPSAKDNKELANPDSKPATGKNDPKRAKAEPARQSGQLTPIEGVANMVAITRPSSPLAVSAPWQDNASPDQLARIDGWQAQFERDKEALLRSGDGIMLAKQGRLFETDAAMLYGLIPPGLYDCRLVQINVATASWHEGQSGKCRVLLQGESRKLSFITTEEVILGDLHENDGFSSVYLGKNLVASMGGVGGSHGAEIGLVQRIADTRWRIILPMESGGTAVVEITRPRLAE